jgi:hypothetical protein
MTRALLAVAFLVLLAVPAVAAGPGALSGRQTLAPGADRALPTLLTSSRGIGAGPSRAFSPPCTDKPRADYDGNGQVTAADLAIWLGFYFGGVYVAAADLDGDGVVGPADFSNWLYLYFYCIGF